MFCDYKGLYRLVCPALPVSMSLTNPKYRVTASEAGLVPLDHAVDI